MVRITKDRSYITEDGREFTSALLAMEHENTLKDLNFASIKDISSLLRFIKDNKLIIQGILNANT